jgi:hypothetical protein
MQSFDGDVDALFQNLAADAMAFDGELDLDEQLMLDDDTDDDFDEYSFDETDDDLEDETE